MRGLDVKDTVTGLMDMESFLKESVHLLEDELDQIVVIYSDLTNFRYFNEVYGLKAGNNLLKKIAEEEYILREECKAATRIYADKCVGVFVTKKEDAINVFHTVEREAEKIEAAFAESVSDVTIRCNLGIHIVKPGENFQEAIDKAEIAWRETKKTYSSRVVEYAKGMEYAKDKEAKVLGLYRRALEEDRFVVHLQPKIDAKTGNLVGAEALVRMLDKEGKLIMPGEFIPILEAAGPIVDVDRFVAGKVFWQIGKWISNGLTPVPISINMSGKHLYSDDFMNNMCNDIEDWNVPAEYIELEVTESVFLGDIDNIEENIGHLRSLGVKISMDDFGAGFSSLNMICLMPIDIIKLDRTFIQNAARGYKGREILKKMVELLEAIDFQVVCEGVETKDELDIAMECGCNTIQGYYYGKPMPIEEFEQRFLIPQNQKAAK